MSSMCHCWAHQDLTDLPVVHVGIISLNYDCNDLYYQIMFVPSHNFILGGTYLVKQISVGEDLWYYISVHQENIKNTFFNFF